MDYQNLFYYLRSQIRIAFNRLLGQIKNDREINYIFKKKLEFGN
jgi:hypothetical protein